VPQKNRAAVKRLIHLAVVGGLVAALVTVTATAAPSTCTHGTSSIGPVVLVHGHLAGHRSGLIPQTSGCRKRR
jgi:hypothetical protein